MNAKLIKVIEEWEEELRQKGYHIGVTGSALYGMGTGKDLDVIVYPHIYGQEGDIEPPARLSPEGICKVLGIRNSKSLGKKGDYSGSPWIWSGTHDDLGRVDVLLLRGNTECSSFHDAEGYGELPEDFLS